jgi:L-amino acid N-acyltransferase YncA
MAEDRDIPAVTEIYNEVLRTSTAIYRDEEASIDERVLWWQSQQQKGYPLFIAEERLPSPGVRLVWRLPYMAGLSLHG